jgi:hypothetical protein
MFVAAFFIISKRHSVCHTELVEVLLSMSTKAGQGFDKLSLTFTSTN